MKRFILFAIISLIACGPDANLKSTAPVRECVTDNDCPHDACNVSECSSIEGCNNLHPRDDDKDGHAVCAGDCNDHDASVHPGATDVCGTLVDGNCDGKFEEGCWEFCNLVPEPNAQANGWYSGCCAKSGKFRTATAPKPGDLIKSMSGELVYYFATNGKRYAHTFTHVLVSWESLYDAKHVPLDDSWVCGKVLEFPDDVVGKIGLAGEVTMKPGTYVTGLATDSQRYVISKGKVLHPLANDAMGKAIFGESYASRIKLTPAIYLQGYKMGAPLASAADYHVDTEFKVSIEEDLGLK